MTKYRKEIEAAAEKHGLQPVLVEAQVLVESSGNPKAYRYEPGFWKTYMAGKPEWAGADPKVVSASYGLMQIMYVVALEMGLDKSLPPSVLFDVETNLEYGCRKLASLMKWSKGNVMQALAAYNGGKGGNTTPPFRNMPYVVKVLTQRSKLVDAYGFGTGQPVADA